MFCFLRFRCHSSITVLEVLLSFSGLLLCWCMTGIAMDVLCWQLRMQRWQRMPGRWHLVDGLSSMHAGLRGCYARYSSYVRCCLLVANMWHG
jgi:hypothetical protein